MRRLPQLLGRTGARARQSGRVAVSSRAGFRKAVVAFVTLKGQIQPSRPLKNELREHVAKHIGAIARPDEIRFTDALKQSSIAFISLAVQAYAMTCL